MSTPEPAIKSYFFGKGYRDLWNTIRGSWKLNNDAARIHFGSAAEIFPGGNRAKAEAIVLFTAGASVVLFGTAIFLLTSALHITVLLVFFSLIYLSFTLVFLSERCFLLAKRYFTVCPHCHEKYQLPEYFFRSCGATHQRLIPSSYGILHHTCTCGEKLPATFFLGRGELKASCTECHQLLEDSHLASRKTFVPIVGGPSVGKSAYLFSALRILIEEKASQLGLTPLFVESRSKSDFERVRDQLIRGQPPNKTLDSLPPAFNIRFDGRGSPRLLYLYDPAGEAFTGTDGLVLHKFQGYSSGMIFLIDLFAIPAVQAEYSSELAPVQANLKPSVLPTEDALSRVLISMEEHFKLGKTERIKKPLAVVLNKVDAFDIEQRIGEAAVVARVAGAAEPLGYDTVRYQLLREQLIRWDLGDLVQQIEARFAKVAYFTCSSLGRMPDTSGRPFAAQGVIEPLMWILKDADSVFR